MMNFIYNKSGITLTETIIAVVLLSFILLAASGIDIASRRILRAADKEAAVFLDIAPAMAHMEKWISLATGEDGDLGIDDTVLDGVDVRVDYDASENCNFTPEDNTDDVWKRYQLVGNDLIYTPDIGGGATEVLATKVVFVNFTFRDVGIQFYVQIELEARYDPSQGASTDNPTVLLESRVFPRTHTTY